MSAISSAGREGVFMPRMPMILLSSLVVVLVVDSAWACCALEPDFAEIARGAPVVVRARVVALSQGQREATAEAPAEYVDMHVLGVKKGQGIASTIRVWDADRYSCMSGGLGGLRVGERIVVAAHRVSEVKAQTLVARAQGSLRTTAVDLPDDDYFIRGCGRYWKARSTSEQRP